MPRKSKVSDELLIKLYREDNLSTYKIADRVGLHQTTIALRIKKLGISKSFTEANKQNTLDENYFKCIDNEEKAYWLGFILADGCVYLSKKFRKHSFQLALKDTDDLHLYKLKKVINYSGKIHYFKRTTEKGYRTGRADLSLCNKKFVYNLINQGIVPRKSNVAKYPNIDSIYNRDVIRGLWDGDGWVSNKGMSLCGTQNVTETIQSILAKENIDTRISKDKRSPNLYSLRAIKKEIPVLCNYLYNHSKVYLDRKYNTACLICPSIK